MIGEFLRESGVLILVFGILEQLVHEGGVGTGWYIGVVFVSSLFLIGGILTERWR